MMVWPLQYPVEEAKQVVLKSWPRIDSEAPCKNKSTNVYRYEDLLLQGPAIMQRIVMASSLLLLYFLFYFHCRAVRGIFLATWNCHVFNSSSFSLEVRFGFSRPQSLSLGHLDIRH